MIGWMLVAGGFAAADTPDCTARICSDGPDCVSSLSEGLEVSADASFTERGATVCLDAGELTEDVRIPTGRWHLVATDPDGALPVLSGTLRVERDAQVRVEHLQVFGPVGQRAAEVEPGASLSFVGAVVGGGGGLQATGGGVVRARGSASLSFERTEVGYGQSYGDGGLIAAPEGRVSLLGGTRLRDGASLQGSGGLVATRDLIVDDRTEDGQRAEIRITGGRAEKAGGALVLSGTGTVSGRLVVDGNQAGTDGGGLALRPGASLVLGDPDQLRTLPGEDRGPLLRDNRAAGSGGAVHVDTDARLDAHLATFLDNQALDGGAIAVSGPGSRIQHSLLCFNRAIETGGAVDAPSAGGPEVRHSIVHGNRADLYGAFSGGGYDIVHSSLIGNDARAVGSAIDTSVASRLRHSIVAFNGLDSVVAGAPRAPRGSHVVWFGNAEPASTSFEASVTADPVLSTSDDASVCSGAAVWPRYESPARDIGGRALDLDADPDGTPLDAGPFSGDAWTSLFIDDDGDGYPRLWDCGERDTTVHPGADDPPYDGLDADCRGDDDFDADGDGYAATDEVLARYGFDGLGFDGDDCDDTRADRFPGNTERPATGIDEDCDGIADEAGPLALRGCATAGAGGGLTGIGLLGLLLLVRRRP